MNILDNRDEVMHLVKVNTIVNLHNNLNTFIYVVNVFSFFGVVDILGEHIL